LVERGDGAGDDGEEIGSGVGVEGSELGSRREERRESRSSEKKGAARPTKEVES